MSIKLRLALGIACCLLAAVLIGTAGAQSMDKMDSMESMSYMPPPQTCAMLPASVMVYSDSPGVQCQQVSGGGIGVQSILDMGVVEAVDVWGSMDITAEVCFSGSGSVTFLDATESPRMEMPLDYAMRDGMTCVDIMHPGTVVLMPSMMMDSMDATDGLEGVMGLPGLGEMDKMDAMDDMDKMDGMDDMDAMDKMDDMDSMEMMDDMDAMNYAMMKDSMDVMVVLIGCEVTPRYNVNFRAEPGGEILGVIAAPTTKSASARTPNWFKVEHREQTGWITAHYVDEEGNCGS